MTETIPSQRHLFDLPRDIAYLNCAYMSPLLTAAVEAGETVMITRRGKAVAQLVPVKGETATRLAALRRLQQLGAGAGMRVDEILSARDEGRR